MTKTLLAAATLLAAVSTPAFADAAPQHTFTRDGDTYVYTTQQIANRTVITGRVLNTGDTFKLAVRGNRVTGISGQRQVSFEVPASTAKAVASTAN